jgi:2-oxoglutarate ferredoxin oxidoreductase subunit alpha
MSKENQVRFMQGNEACAEGAIAAGCMFYGGYPITPSSEIAEVLSRRLPQVGGKFIQMEDEISAMASTIGASLTGAKSMTATSGPGFSLKQENIGYASLTEIPCVIVNVMRGGPSTGLPTSPAQADLQQAIWGTHGDHPVIVMTPTTVQEIYEQTIRAFNLAEQYRVPVVLLLDEINGHMREKVVIPHSPEVIDRKRPDVKPEEYKPYDDSQGDVPPMADFGTGYRFHVTGLMHDETGFPTGKADLVEAKQLRIMRKISNNADTITDYRSRFMDDAETLVVSYGSTARSVNHAVSDLHEAGDKVGSFRPMVVHPFPAKALDEKISDGTIKRILVAELSLGQLRMLVEDVVQGRVPVYGLNKVDGEPITPDEVIAKIKEVQNVS